MRQAYPIAPRQEVTDETPVSNPGVDFVLYLLVFWLAASAILANRQYNPETR